MLSTSLQRFRHGINRARKSVATNVLYLCLAPGIGECVVFNHFANVQPAEGRNSVTECCFALCGNVVSNFAFRLPKEVYPVMELLSAISKAGAFNPRSKPAHEAGELADAGFSRAFGSFFPGLFVASGLQNVEAVTSRQGREARKNQSGIFSVGHLWICLFSGVLGWIAFGLFREWRLRREAQLLHRGEAVKTGEN
jgi:hypothetical protein